MSYEKKTTPDLIRFYYETDSVFKQVSEATSFKAASVIREKDGQPDFDRIQISADEKNFMKKYLKEAMIEIFGVMFKIIGGDSVTNDTLTEIGDAVSAGNFVVGSQYKIVDAGTTTTWAEIGADAETAGTVFTATGVGEGDGTAVLYEKVSYADVIDNTPASASVTRYRTINLDLIDQLINNAIIDFIIYKWYALKGLGGDTEIHMNEFRNGLARINEKTLALRQPTA